MFYIHQTSCISPQKGSDSVRNPVDNLLTVIEPGYEGIPGNALRRMSKSVRLGVGAALPLLPQSPDGILIGTGYGGMEDSVKFLKQIIEYDEGILTPGPFVQSTANAIASQIGLFSRNRGYNITHVNRGLAFESALLDAALLVKEHPDRSYLTGGVDEISDHNYRFESAEGWYKKEPVSGNELYTADSPGSIAGEGAALFLVNGIPTGALAQVKGIAGFWGTEEATVKTALQHFLDRHLPAGTTPDLLLSGENGDNRALKWYQSGEAMMGADTTVVRFKHLCGEYPTASAFALWLACNLPEPLPEHLVKRASGQKDYRTILIHNNYKFNQHSLILLEKFL